jgi:hypothetical protein
MPVATADRKRKAPRGPPEYDPGPAKGEPACRKRPKTSKECYVSPQVQEMVIAAVDNVDPFWDVTSFRFRTPEIAITFWGEVCESKLVDVYDNYQTPANPLRKLLQSLGYRDVPEGKTRNNNDKWQSCTEWRWDMLAALSNCMWFSGKVQPPDVRCCLALAFRDSPRADMISPLVVVASPQVFKGVTDEVAKTRHKASFHFHETCDLAQAKVELLMFLSKKLDQFTENGDIVDLKKAVLRFDQDALRTTMGRHATAHADSVSAQEQL